MAARVITALTALLLLLGLLLGGRWELFAGAVVLFGFVGLEEFYRACEAKGMQPARLAGIATTGLLFLGATPWGAARVGPYREALLVALLMAAMLGEIARRGRAPVANLGATLLGVVYVGWLFSHLILLRVEGAALLARMGGQAPTLPMGIGADGGGWLLLLIFLATSASDTGAFFAGRRWGKRKLAPTLSPGKTVEGAVGGALAPILISGVCGQALGMPLAASLLLGGAVGILGPLGDLWESALKRELGVKDFGAILPGHGGVLDRFDSVLFTAPTIYHVVKHWPF